MAVLRVHLLNMLCTVFMICLLREIQCRVPDDVVDTDWSKTAQKGDELVLKCNFYGTPFAVFWKKGDDPLNSPDLITRVEGQSPFGSCVHDGSCRMRSDYSLIIRNIKIADEGTYICVVSNKEILIHNFTDIAVIAPPMEPFPIFDECPLMLPNETEQTCSLSTSDNVTITCSTSGYFPDINLFFLHGSNKMDTTNAEVTNLDGTKNKSISTIATASEIPYECVASDIPGLQYQRNITVTVNSFPVTRSPRDKAKGGVAIHVVVIPVTVVLLLAVCVALLLWDRWKQKKQGLLITEEASPLRPAIHVQIEGKISFFELWCLVNNMEEVHFPKLRTVFKDLDIHGMKEDAELTPEVAYDLLCDWKDANTCRDGRVEFRNRLMHADIDTAWKDLHERMTSNSDVSEELLEHIGREIGNKRLIDCFLNELIIDLPVSPRKRESIMKEPTYMQKLRKWRESSASGSQVILLSLALEKANCRPLDRTFFKVPGHLLKAISPQEVNTFVYRLTGRHCTRLATAVDITSKREIEAIIDENNKYIFDTCAVVSDWIARAECSNFKQRCRLDDAIIRIGRHDMIDFFGTTSCPVEMKGMVQTPHLDTKSFSCGSVSDEDLGISLIDEEKDHVLDLKDDELESVVENITSTEKVQELTSRLGIDIGGQHEQLLLESLKGWRDNHEIENHRQVLWKALHEMELSGCMVVELPLQHVYEAEMVRLAYSILSNDVGPLATLLGMDMSKGKIVGEKLKGTVGLLIRLLKKLKKQNQYPRRDFCDELINLGYPDVARSAFFGYEASLSELCNITSGLTRDEMEKLIEYLELDKDVLGTTEGYNNLALLKTWRNQIRPQLIHFRCKLASGLQAIGRTKIASEILAGQYRTTQINDCVIEDICNSLGDGELEKLCKYLVLYGLDIQKDRTTAIKSVVQWVRNWLQQFDKAPAPKAVIKDKFNFRRSKNDELFKAGFIELAEEIMLLDFPRFPSI